MQEVDAGLATKQEKVAELQKELESQLVQDDSSQKDADSAPMEIEEVLGQLGISLTEEQIRKLGEWKTKKRPRLEGPFQLGIPPQPEQRTMGGKVTPSQVQEPSSIRLERSRRLYESWGPSRLGSGKARPQATTSGKVLTNFHPLPGR